MAYMLWFVKVPWPWPSIFWRLLSHRCHAARLVDRCIGRDSEAERLKTFIPLRGFPIAPNLIKYRQIMFAKLMASCWLFSLWLGRIVLSMLLFIWTIELEWSLKGLPESEAPWLVGQWAAFVYVGLTLLVALIIQLFVGEGYGANGKPHLILSDHPKSTRLVTKPRAGLTSYSDHDLFYNPSLVWREFTAWWSDPGEVSKQD